LLAEDPRYKTNNQRVQARPELLPQVSAVIARYPKAELMAKLEHTGLPFAPIGKPEELFEDPHLLASGGLAPVRLPDGSETHLPALPIKMDNRRAGSSSLLARPGEHTFEVLQSAGFTAAEIETLTKKGVIAGDRP